MSVHFIAEVSSNHNKDLDRCLKFIDISAEVGCDAVKFQLFKIEELFIPEVVSAKNEIAKRRAWELPTSFLPYIAEHCRAKGVEFACTPFYLQAVEELYPYVDYYKIASYELLWVDLLKECARSGKPLVLSTGMATLDEVEKAVETITAAGGHNLSLLHCNSGYPAPPEHCNLAAIETLHKRFKMPVGWSDHSVHPGVICRAVHRWGAVMVEFHLDLEGKGEEFAAGHCWLPEKIAPVIANINTGLIADGGSEKKPMENESFERKWRADPSDGLRPLCSIRQRWWK